MPKNATVTSIAKDLGISHMTVSRALNNHPNVREETRKMILERADQLGYTKSVAANALRGGQTGTIGLILPTLRNPFYAGLADNLARLCSDDERSLVIHLTDEDPKLEADAIRRLKQLQADKIVLVPVPEKPSLDIRLLEGVELIQLVRVRSIPFPSTTVAVEDAQAIAQAVDHLAHQSIQRIGYIGPGENLSSGQRRLSAFEKAINQNGLTAYASAVQLGEPRMEFGRTAMQALLTHHPDLEAVMCGGFEVSRGALEVLMEAGVKLGEELAFVGYGDEVLYSAHGLGVSVISVASTDVASETYRAICQDSGDGHAVRSVPAAFIARKSSKMPLFT